MESRSYFQQAPHSPINLCPTRCRPRDPAQNLQQCRLTRTVSPDHSQHFPLFHFQVHIPQRPERFFLFPLQELPRRTQNGTQHIPERIFPLQLPYLVSLAQTLRPDCNLAHPLSRFSRYFILPAFRSLLNPSEFVVPIIAALASVRPYSDYSKENSLQKAAHLRTAHLSAPTFRTFPSFSHGLLKNAHYRPPKTLVAASFQIYFDCCTTGDSSVRRSAGRSSCA